MSQKGIRAWIAAGAVAAGVIGTNWWNVSNRIDDRARDILEAVERRQDESNRERRDDFADVKDGLTALGRRVDTLAEGVQTLIGDVGYIKGILDVTREETGPAD